MSTADVTVYGAGAFGLSVAWECARRGAQVQVIDPKGVAGGASGGIVGALAPHTPENWNEKKQFQFESLILAERFWREVDEVGGGSSGYARLGRLQPLPDDRAVEQAKSRAASAQQLWQGLAKWQVVPCGERRGWEPTSATGFLIEDTLSARLHPNRACEALARAIRAKGGRIGPEGDAQGAIVWATGFEGLLAMSEALGEPVGNGVKGQALLLDYDARDQPQLFADGLHIVPHTDGSVAIGSTSEREWEAPASTDALLDTVYARAISAFPVLQRAPVIARWAGVRPRAKSRAPMLGVHPVCPGEFVANGGFKIGFGMAPKVGQVMADLVLEGKDMIPEPFRVEASLRKT